MKRSIGLVVSIAIVLGASILFSADKPGGKASKSKPDFTTTDPNAPTAEYEIRIGDRSYDVSADVPLDVITPKGERVTLVLHPKDILNYKGDGVSFSYPRSMTSTVKKSKDSTTVTLRGELNVVAMVQVFSIDSADQIETLLIDGFNRVLGEGKPSVASPATRTIGGVSRTGKLLRFSGKGLQTELYVFSKSGTTVALVLQCPTAKADSVKKSFDMVAETLK